MKKFIKNNYITVISFSILLIFAIYNIANYTKWYDNYAKVVGQSIEECKKEYLEEQKESCEILLKQASTEEISSDYYYMSREVLSNFGIIYYITFLFVTIPVIYNVCKVFKNKELIYEMTRQNYSDFKKKIFKEAYLKSLIIPLLLLIIFIITFIFCKGSAGNIYFEEFMEEGFLEKVISPFLYTFTILIRSFLISIIYINISLIVVRKNHNFYIASILSYLLFIGIEVVLEGVIGRILLNNILKTNSMEIYINILNMFNLNFGKGYIMLYIPIIIILILSFIILHIKYKNKEKLIIDCEKNN